MSRVALFAGSVLVAAACAPAVGETQAPAVELRQCEVPGVQGAARCGTYTVRENRAARSGRQIPINIVVIPAREAAREPDPIFYLDGGPGGAATEAAPWVARLLDPLRASRDLVFIDVRGTGRSNLLRCPPPPGASLQRYFDEFLPDASVRACLDAQQADVRFYTEPIAMDDVDEIRAALGYARVNVFGTSGGTRQAQLYLRQHGDRVRSVVMHGVHPIDGEMPLPYSRAMEAATRALIERCRAEDACRQEHPDLAAAWEQVKRRFVAGSVSAEVEHPRTGRSERVRISKGMFAEGMRHLMYDFTAAASLPDVITAAARGDYKPFAARHIERTDFLERAVARGMFLSATCAEDVRFISEEDIQRETTGTFLGDYRVRRQQAACRIWPAGHGIDERFQEPVRSNVPVLMISGDADVATPASNGERLARTLTNSRHVVFRGQGHNLVNPACATRLIAAFVTHASPADLDTSCAH